MRPVLAPLLILFACAAEPEGALPWGEAPPDGANERVPQYYGGCGDIVMYAHNGPDTRAIFVNLPDVAQTAHQQGQTITALLTLPHPSATVTLKQGARLTSATCVGAMPMPGPRVDASLTATGGTLEVRVTPDPAGSPNYPIATADVRLTGLQFVTPAGQLLPVPDMTLPGVSVGLYPP
jgi:hypothetical protein